MNESNLARHGFPVLTYLTPEPLSLPFTLRIQYHDARKQVTLMLRTHAAYVHGADGKTAFVAQYDADNLLPGTRRNTTTFDIPQGRRDGVARNAKDCEWTTLTLCLKKPCPLWCPYLEAFTPAPSENAVKSLNELVRFAKATTIHIVFDRDWLSPEQRAPLSWLLKGKYALTGFPVDRYYGKHFRHADWTVFRPLVEAPKRGRRASGSPSSPPPYKRRTADEQPEPGAIPVDIANEVQSPTELATSPAKSPSPDPFHEAPLAEQGLRKAIWEGFAPTEAAKAPPAYEGSQNRKRSRQGSFNSPIQPLRCPTPNSPTGSHSSEKTIPYSPETAAAGLRRAHLEYRSEIINAAIEKRLSAHLDEVNALQAERIDAAVARQLSAYFHEARHGGAVDAAVSRQLDTALQARLPDALENFLIPGSLPSSPATSFTSFDSRGNRYPRLPPLTRVGRAMLPHLRTHLTDQFKLYQQQQLQRFEKVVDAKYSDVERDAYDDRVEAQGNFEMEMEEHKAEISLLRKDTIDDLWREGDAILEQGRAVCLAFGEDINEQLVGICGRIDRLNRYALRKMVVAEVSRQQRRKKGVPKGWGRNLLRGEHRLLGRRREVEDEWADV